MEFLTQVIWALFYEQQPGMGLAIRKETLRRRGLLASAKTRAPGPSLDTVAQGELDGLIERLEIRLDRLSLGPD